MNLRLLIMCPLCMTWFACSAMLSAEIKPSDVTCWEQDITAFEAADKATGPIGGGVLFYGSSSIRLWDLTSSFPELQTVNRGFGGSGMAAAAHFYERVVPPHRPRVVVLYEGDNDLASGRTPCQVAADFETLVAKHRQALPEARLVCLSVKHSPSRARLRLEQEAVNALLKARCAHDPRLTFVDSARALLDEDGQPQANYFMPDLLHLNSEGYGKWNALLLPLLERATKTP
jgi:lysophospholipase L1-like esterase